ncbi:Protein ALP1-like, partial [Linum grandiflorum]
LIPISLRINPRELSTAKSLPGEQRTRQPRNADDRPTTAGSTTTVSFSASATGYLTPRMARLMAANVQRRRLLLTMVFAVVLIVLIIRRRHRRALNLRTPPQSIVARLLEGQQTRAMFMKKATRTSDRSSIDILRLSMHVFERLCSDLQSKGGLTKYKSVEIDEMVAMFLRTIGHNVRNRIVQKEFCRSSKTVCGVIHAVLQSILNMHRIMYVQAEPVPEQPQDPHWKHFKNCLGALDGTYVKCNARVEDQARYRNRKGDVTISVLGVCNPKMEWIYCLAGWEGSAHDSRILKDALSRPNGLKVPKGYYLCDAGYTNCEGFFTPFRNQRYHLKEWGGNRPNTPEEYYNMKHSSARNVIERAFGVLKKRWGILRDTTWFSPEVMSRMVHACMLLHNFIRKEVGIDELEESFDDDITP